MTEGRRSTSSEGTKERYAARNEADIRSHSGEGSNIPPIPDLVSEGFIGGWWRVEREIGEGRSKIELGRAGQGELRPRGSAEGGPRESILPAESRQPASDPGSIGSHPFRAHTLPWKESTLI